MESLRAAVWAWRRRHAPRRIALQRQILAGQQMVGLDVGAAEGLQPHWWDYEGAVDMYLFEPHPPSAERLERLCAKSPYRSTFKIVQCALARETGRREFHVLNVPTGSSLYPIDPASEFAERDNDYIYPIRVTHVDVQKTADALDQNGVERVDIAKLDVQGAELEILEGMDERRLRELTLVEAEVNIVGGIGKTLSPYVGAPTWAELDRFLVSHGMRLLDLSVARQPRTRNGDADWYQREVFGVYANSPGISAMAWEADVVYVRDYRALIERRDGAALRRLIVALGGYRFFSEAYYVVDEAEKARVFEPQTAAELRRDIVAWHRLVARRPWHGRGALWRALRTALRRTGLSQLRRWKQYMWFEYPNG